MESWLFRIIQRIWRGKKYSTDFNRQAPAGYTALSAQVGASWHRGSKLSGFHFPQLLRVLGVAFILRYFENFWDTKEDMWIVLYCMSFIQKLCFLLLIYCAILHMQVAQVCCNIGILVAHPQKNWSFVAGTHFSLQRIPLCHLKVVTFTHVKWKLSYRNV